jgi:hypothetical protein
MNRSKVTLSGALNFLRFLYDLKLLDLKSFRCWSFNWLSPCSCSFSETPFSSFTLERNQENPHDSWKNPSARHNRRGYVMNEPGQRDGPREMDRRVDSREDRGLPAADSKGRPHSSWNQKRNLDFDSANSMRCREVWKNFILYTIRCWTVIVRLILSIHVHNM